jgi:hypothetical protein
MVQVLHMITLKGGEQVELLATPALFAIAKRRGWTIEADADNAAEVFSAYTKLIYLAALNAWEVRRYDSPEMGECSYRLMDFVEWASSDTDAFVKAVNFVLSALTGKELKDYATEGAKPSQTAEKTANESDDEDVKKKSKSRWITRLFRRSS